jgi:O-methyltransferase
MLWGVCTTGFLLAGYVIIDDYGAIPICKRAVEDFRAEHKIAEQLQQMDWTGVFWEKRLS